MEAVIIPVERQEAGARARTTLCVSSQVRRRAWAEGWW